MGRRFSIVLTEEQAAALRAYASEGWRKPSTVIRIALFRYLSNKALFRVPRPPSASSDGYARQSSAKVDVGHFLELWKTHLSPSGGGFREKTERQAFWTLMRAKVFDRDGYLCKLCGSNGQGRLHVHHIIARRDGGRDLEENLVTLCPSCHSRSDHGLRDPDSVFSLIRQKPEV